MARGQLTEEVQIIARGHIGRNLSLRELRLIPYIQHVMVNDQKLDIRKINDEERQILSMWREAGWIEGGASGLTITKDFWDFMVEVLWQAYVVQASDNWKAMKNEV